MTLLTLEENRFLDVFLHEATTAPFSGMATKAYEQEVPRSGFAVGHAADIAPPLPWPNVKRHYGETSKSSGFGRSDNSKRRRWDRMDGSTARTWPTKPVLEVIQEDGLLGRELATNWQQHSPCDRNATTM
jgi:hypothetical protein